MANNTRHLILPGVRIGNLASRVLGLSVRRLSADIAALHGNPVFLAETFVDPSRFRGTCYLASNRSELGNKNRAFGRPHDGWVAHGQPKRVFEWPLPRSA